MAGKYKNHRGRLRQIMDRLFDLEPGNRAGRLITGAPIRTVQHAFRQWARDNRIPDAKFRAARAEKGGIEGVRVWRKS